MFSLTLFSLIAQNIFVMLFLTYVFYVVNLYGVQPSLSNSYYVLPGYRKWIWTFICLMSFVGLGPSWFQLSDIIIPNWSFLCFFSVGGLCLVGIKPAFKNKSDSTLHFIGAFVAGGSSLLWCILAALKGYYDLWIILFLCIVSGFILIFSKKENTTWWAEMIAFANMIITIEYLSILFKH